VYRRSVSHPAGQSWELPTVHTQPQMQSGQMWAKYVQASHEAGANSLAGCHRTFLLASQSRIMLCVGQVPPKTRLTSAVWLKYRQELHDVVSWSLLQLMLDAPEVTHLIILDRALLTNTCRPMMAYRSLQLGFTQASRHSKGLPG